MNETDNQSQFDAESNVSAEGAGQAKELRLRDIVLPDGLQKRVLKQYLMSAVFILSAIALSIIYKEPVFLFALVLAGALIYLAISTTYDYANGDIEEVAVICASVNTAAMRKTTRVIFRTDGDPPTYYEFIVPGKVTKNFSPNFAYVIYYKPCAPKTLLGYTPI